jgi:hypothetical protein
MKDDFFDYLPNGQKFAFWDCRTDFTKTYYVSRAAEASDANSGSREAPFATIGKAAATLQSGERVIIGGGVYDEFVRPLRGGEGPQKMISYEAAPGEKVVITGGRRYRGEWKDLQGWRAIGMGFYYNLSDHYDPESKIYEGNFERDDFDKINPFSQVNCASQAYVGCRFWFHYIPEEQDWQPFLKRRGLVFCDGELLVQVNYINQLSQVPGSYWVEDSGFTFFVRLKDDSNPKDHTITYTCRDQLFAPATPYTGYVRVKGIEFECVGNGVPGSQKGAVSTCCGHHWIIEDNTIRYANGVGIDIGYENPMRSSEGGSAAGSAGNIVRRNHISWVGACGIAGAPGRGGNSGVLVESNVIEHTPWLDIEFNWESGGIKLHAVRNSLIRFNILKDLPYGPGIWTDSVCANERICGNVILGGRSLIFGGIFIEGSDKINQVDHNVIWDIHANPLGTGPQRTSGGGHGIYEHDSDNILIERNILLGMEGGGIFLNWGDPVRICNGHSPQGSGYRIIGNIISGCGRAYTFPAEKNFSDGNILGNNKAMAPIQIERNKQIYEMMDMGSARAFHNWEEKGKCCDIRYAVDPDKMTMEILFIVHDQKFSQTYDLTKPCDIQPVIDFLAPLDTSGYDSFSFFI